MRVLMNTLRYSLKRWATLTTAILLLLTFAPAYVSAIARGYTSDDAGLQNGMVVALSTKSNDSDKVERASQENNQRIVGVVTNLDNSLVTVASGSSKVLVESEGQVDAYVNDMNGTVKNGDLLVISPLRGVLMKAGDSTSTVVGIAAADFSSAQADTYKVQEGSGSKDVKIAKIKINLNRSGASNAAASAANSSLSKLGKAIVGKDVGEIRVLIALVIFFIVLVAEGGILYGAISSAITALGRNPLARKVIRREMIKVVLIAFMVLIVGLAAIYAILWI